ncbi:MAG TPA: His/Gly/Thr/Pro-type tRNA ligase C-terminal domain-containing protein [Clostridiales bacterium]|nr:His/Gly/Thr/Pro-type tRNA ligase C-terminal domain-containing protein [Clostridiales bacterium]HQP70330.1 His/Gly/Thr/Pro-type tRNA ligase C-terminal domain-containing protein [Clostridiales bacterium]
MLESKKDNTSAGNRNLLTRKVVSRELSDPFELALAFLASKKFLQSVKDPSGSYRKVWGFAPMAEKMTENLLAVWKNSTAGKLGNVKYIEEVSEKTGTEYFIEMFDQENQKVPCGFSRVLAVKDKYFSTDRFIFHSPASPKLMLEYTTVPSLAKDMLMTWLDFIVEFMEKLGVSSDHLDIEYQKLEDHPESDHFFFDRYSIKNNFLFGHEEIATVSNKIDFEFENYDKRFPDEKKQKCFVKDEYRNTEGFPYVIEVMIDVNRFVLAAILNNFHQENIRTSVITTLKFSPQLAPVKCAVFPLSIVDKKTREAADRIYKDLSKLFETAYDEKSTLEMRTVQYDELGVPFYITVDPDLADSGLFTLHDNIFGTRADMDQDDIAEYIISKIDE